ncbi:MAG: glycosyltransferase family 39 protein [Verrucomicrobia bacterium]|nr:glycosyltransferase family 39 protein [Verrucomicrobiota bacterium]MDA1087069.1 glycosyltransferase family 39 protein [Verrucomicrobiota bacterium]
MNPIARTLNSNRAAAVLCVLIIAVSFSMFGFTLARYPIYFDDEPFFNLSAVRFLTGKSFAYVVHPDAPHAGDLWAYHSPLFFRMQVLTFKIFGLNHFSCRIPSWMGCHLAIGMLCGLLIRHRMRLAAIMIACLWIGDSSTQEMLLGRPDGVALLGVAAGFYALVGAVTTGSVRWSVACGIGLGLAVGMNIATIYFVPAAALALLAICPLRVSLRLLIGFGIGLAAMALVFVSFWLPRPLAAGEQFRWFVEFHEKDFSSIRENWIGIVGKLGRGKYWILALIAGWLAVLVPAAAVKLRQIHKHARCDPASTIVVSATLFTAAALALFSLSSMYRYYLTFFTPWPVLGMAVLAGQAVGTGVKQRIAAGLMCAILGAAWLPSLVWNGLKLRENLTFYSRLDDEPTREFLARALPRETRVVADPKYFLLLNNAGIEYEPLPWYASIRSLSMPDDSSLVISRGYHSVISRDRPEWIEGRTLIAFTNVFPRVIAGAKWLREPFYVYGPAGHDRR